MTNSPHPAADSHPAGMIQAMGVVLRSLGFVVANTNLYGPHHAVTRNVMKESLAVIRGYLAQFGALDIAVHPDGFIAGNTPVGDRSTSTQLLRTRLTALGIDFLTLLPEVQDDEFERLVAILVTPPPKEGAVQAQQQDLFAAGLFTHIKSAKYTYQRVSEDEAVVSKSSQESAGAGQAESLDALVSQVAAFLKGQEMGSAELARLCERDDSADQLTACILDTAGQSNPNGEWSAEALVTGLQRACSGLMQAASNRTQKGRQNVKRLLVQVEKNMREQIAGLEGSDKAAAAISAAVEELAEDLEIEGVVARYLKQKALSEATVERIRRQVRRAAKDDAELAALHDKLLEAGLTPEGWHSLLEPELETPTDMAATLEAAEARAARLRTLLSNLEQAANPIAGPEASSQTAAQAVTLANRQVTEAIGGAAAKIKALEDLFFQQGPSGENKQGIRMTLRKLRELLAEIAQELRQPLTVVNAAIEMLKGQHPSGDPDDATAGLLELATSSGEQLDVLIGRLVDIAGVPKDLSPDSRILDALYNRTSHRA